MEPVGFIWAALGPNLMYIGTVWATKGDALVLLASAPQGEAIGGQDGLGWGQQENTHSLIEELGLERTTAVRSRPKDSSLCHHCSTTVAVNNFVHQRCYPVAKKCPSSSTSLLSDHCSLQAEAHQWKKCIVVDCLSAGFGLHFVGLLGLTGLQDHLF